MKIVHVLPPNSPVTATRGGAVERIVLSIADRQAQLGHDVRVFSANESRTHTRESGLKIERVRVRLTRPLCDLEYLLKVRRRLRNSPADVLHAHSAPFAAWLAGRHARSATVTLNFYRFKGSNSRAGRTLYRFLLSKFTSVSSITEFSARAAADYFHLPSMPEVVHCGVDLTEFNARRETSVVELPAIMTGGRVALYVGRINEQKGAKMLRPLADRLQRHGISLVACGPLAYFHGEGSSQESAWVAPPVHYLGAVEQDILPAIMAAADVLVLPTIADEMFGMVLIEAGACGTPAVASDLGGIPEVLGDGGVLAPVGAIDDFSAAIVQLVESQDQLARLSDLARRNAVRFGWDRIVEQVLSGYRRDLGTIA